jgi:hypothetical protein
MLHKEKILIFVVVLLLVLTAGASFYRFAIQKDYVVSYEGDCNPETESCYVDCEDDECTSEYYFTVIERMAWEIYELCGPDVSECDEAYECQSNVDYCEITYCDSEIEDVGTCDDINPLEL